VFIDRGKTDGQPCSQPLLKKMNTRDRSGAKRLYILRAERQCNGRVDPNEWYTCRRSLVQLLGMSSRIPFKPLQKPVDVQ
ncbi:hypothetical protein, partial [Rhizobium johnstonii]|uniref:hypothetical protein n=1 Tax=Rhizobium johnstonii TaxID=3019933 RepID=UPI003F952235